MFTVCPPLGLPVEVSTCTTGEKVAPHDSDQVDWVKPTTYVSGDAATAGRVVEAAMTGILQAAAVATVRRETRRGAALVVWGGSMELGCIVVSPGSDIWDGE